MRAAAGRRGRFCAAARRTAQPSLAKIIPSCSFVRSLSTIPRRYDVPSLFLLRSSYSAPRLTRSLFRSRRDTFHALPSPFRHGEPPLWCSSRVLSFSASPGVPEQERRREGARREKGISEEQEA